MKHDNDNDTTILMGAKAIAGHLGVTQRQAYRLIYECGLPHFKLGGTVAARRSTISWWIAEQEASARKATA
ncbi:MULTISPECIES: DNA-binding protein [unclassified Shinella]|uniref:helix-turn-helix transcriptional regulator n=1 Tax=unclassified Shinella TaxID=2643062 RepID=UPI00225C455C|nr:MULTISPECIES: DNA-binding protein [unclassified Shinella]MCO5138324.1 DNA-binding protein [Shinella sp.]MDC7255161.1 DNA-binding protein [Shinella sp. YE25]CAI0337923.1 AlpA family transcriptional regulator [Rhizobiaceae bacterium]CAK7256390.1 AlpA family transcriptional regulator [Shinella sp. WSC3-e]